MRLRILLMLTLVSMVGTRLKQGRRRGQQENQKKNKMFNEKRPALAFRILVYFFAYLYKITT